MNTTWEVPTFNEHTGKDAGFWREFGQGEKGEIAWEMGRIRENKAIIKEWERCEDLDKAALAMMRA